MGRSGCRSNSEIAWRRLWVPCLEGDGLRHVGSRRLGCGTDLATVDELGRNEELLGVFSGARIDGVVPSWADLVAVQIERVEFRV